MVLGFVRYLLLVVTLLGGFLQMLRSSNIWLLGTLKIFCRFSPQAYILLLCLQLMQCSIPVFEGLLPEPHNLAILQLLFHLAHWHGLAKLRMDNDVTLAILDKETTIIGRLLWTFKANICTQFLTKELKREAEAQKRRETAKDNQGGQSSL